MYSFTHAHTHAHTHKHTHTHTHTQWSTLVMLNTDTEPARILNAVGQLRTAKFARPKCEQSKLCFGTFNPVSEAYLVLQGFNLCQDQNGAMLCSCY
jgi:hypothetical protein